jgi:hypothetical protein
MAVAALNAGQFTGGTLGLAGHGGTEVQPPGNGPLSTAIVADPSGGVDLLSPAEADSARSAGGVAVAFQSYPTLLKDEGVVPEALRAAGRGVDVRHRDARPAICSLRDGRLRFALTRFTGLGAALPQPVGPTTPEMAALMGALGCARADCWTAGCLEPVARPRQHRHRSALAGHAPRAPRLGNTRALQLTSRTC